MEKCWSPKTSLVYGCAPEKVRPASRFDDGPGYFRFQKDVKGKSHYGEGMGDCALICGTALSGLVDRYLLTKDPATAETARKVARGVLNLATAHGFPGFVARGLCAEDGKSVCSLSSRDQYTHWLHGLLRYVESGMAETAFREEFVRALTDVAKYMERLCTPERNWNFGMVDGSDDPRGICTMWGPDLHPHEWARLPMIYGTAWHLTGDGHWKALYEKIVDEALEKSQGMSVEKETRVMPCYSLLQAMCSFEAILVFEKAPGRVAKLKAAMAATAAVAEKRARLELKDRKRRFYGMCDDGELSLTMAMRPDAGDTAFETAFRELIVTRQPLKTAGTCRNAHVFAAWWRGASRHQAAGFVPTGCPDFVVEKPRPTSGAFVRAADYGFSPSSDKNAAAINRALADAKRYAAAGVELAPGTYRCFDEPGIRIEGFRDFRFEGRGAVLVFRRPAEYRGQPQSELILDKGNVLVRDCERTEVRDFTVDWEWEADPLGAFVRCTERHEDVASPEKSYVELTFVDWEKYPKYPEPVPVQKMMAMAEDRTHFRAGGGFSFGQTEGHFGARNEWVKPNVLRVWPGIPMEGRNQNPMVRFTASPQGNLRRVRQFEPDGLYRLQHCYYGKNALNLDGNRHLAVRNVNVWSAFGMAMVTDGKNEFTEVENLRVKPPTAEAFAAAYPGVKFRPRPVSSTSDGFHIARSKGYFRLLNCLWTLNNDDSINFHDRFTIAVRGGDRVLDIVNRRGAEYFRVEPGAEVELRYPNFAPSGFRAKVTRVVGNRVYVDRTMPPQKGQCFLVWDRTYGTDNVHVKGCVFEDSGFRNIFSPSNLTIEDCTFRRVNGYPIRFIADYRSDLWCEGMGATNLVVRNCRFEGGPVLQPKWAAISAVCVTPTDWNVGKVDPGFVAGDVLIEGCTFVKPTGPALDFSTGRNVIFRNSTIDLTGVDSAKWPEAGKVKLEAVAGSRVEGIRYQLAPYDSGFDVLKMPDGSRIASAADWEARAKPQIFEFFERNVYGKLPPMPRRLSFEKVESADDALDGLARRRQFRVVSADELGSHAFDVLVYLPKRAKGPVPAFVCPNFWGNHSLSDDPAVILPTSRVYRGKRADEADRGRKSERIPVRDIVAKGFAIATFCASSVYADVGLGQHDLEGSIWSIFPPAKRGRAMTLTAWAWGNMRTLDLLETMPEINARHVAVVGQSRMAKVAVITAAYDRRFSLCCPNDGGCKTLTLVPNLMFPSWFLPELTNWTAIAKSALSSAETAKLRGEKPPIPFDQYSLIGCIAPRHLYLGASAEDVYAPPDLHFAAVRKSAPVWRLYGKTRVPADARMLDPEPFFGDISWHCKSGPHSLTRVDWAHYLDFAAKLWDCQCSRR